MIKCLSCANYIKQGNKSACIKCKTKIIYGTVQEMFIPQCRFYAESDTAKKDRIKKWTETHRPIVERWPEGNVEVAFC